MTEYLLIVDTNINNFNDTINNAFKDRAKLYGQPFSRVDPSSNRIEYAQAVIFEKMKTLRSLNNHILK